MAADAPSDRSRWSALFEDLDAQFAAELSAQRDDELAERLRYETGRRTLVERLRAAQGSTLRVGCRWLEPLTLTVVDVGPDWLLGDEARNPSCEWVLALRAISWIEGLGPYVDAREPERVWTAMDFRRVVRALAAERATVAVALEGGRGPGGVAWEHGRFDRVYADHVDLLRQDVGEARPLAVRAMPIRAISAIRRLS